MTDQLDYISFLELYRRYEEQAFTPTKSKLKEILRSFENMAFWLNYKGYDLYPASRTPIQRIRTRIKRPEAIVDKIRRKPEEYPHGLSESSLLAMQDIVGGRVIVYFLSDLSVLDDVIRNSEEFELSTTNPPEAYVAEGLQAGLDLSKFKVATKESGYVAFHYTARLRNGALQYDVRPIWFEIQVRTIAEDSWAEIEHVLGYKGGTNSFADVREQFRILSSMLQAIDRHFNLIASTLSARQQAVRVSEISEDTRLNTEILPAILLESKGIRCEQKEMNAMIKVLVSRKVETAGKLKAGLASPRFGLIEAVYARKEKRKPRAFEIMANLPHIIYAKDDAEATDLIMAQIEYDRVWKDILVRGEAE